MATKKPKKRPRLPRKVLSLDNLPPILIKYYGSYAAVARHFKITRASVEQFVHRYPKELGPVVRQAKESLIDDAQEGLGWHVKKKDQRAIEFVLSTLGKRRGFIKQMEITGADPATGALPIQILLPSNGREMAPPVPPAEETVSHDENQNTPEDGPAEASGDDSESVPV